MYLKHFSLWEVPIVEVGSMYKWDRIGLMLEIIVPVRSDDFSEKRDLPDVFMKPSGLIMQAGKAVDIAHPIVEKTN